MLTYVHDGRKTLISIKELGLRTNDRLVPRSCVALGRVAFGHVGYICCVFYLLKPFNGTLIGASTPERLQLT